MPTQRRVSLRSLPPIELRLFRNILSHRLPLPLQTKITWPILPSEVILKIPGSTSRITNILPCPVTARGSWELFTPIPSEELPAQLDQDGQESVTLRGNLESKPDRY